MPTPTGRRSPFHRPPRFSPERRRINQHQAHVRACQRASRALKEFLASPPPKMKRDDRDDLAVYLGVPPPPTSRPLAVVQRMLGDWSRGKLAAAYVPTLCVTDPTLSLRFGNAIDRLIRADAIEMLHVGQAFRLVRSPSVPGSLARLIARYNAYLDGEKTQ